MRDDKEIVGNLLGFDDFVSKLNVWYSKIFRENCLNFVCLFKDMVLEDVIEYENTPEGRKITKLEEILLNGNNITMVSNKLKIYVFN